VSQFVIALLPLSVIALIEPAFEQYTANNLVHVGRFSFLMGSREQRVNTVKHSLVQ